MTPIRSIGLPEIKSVMSDIDLLEEMKSGFLAYSRGECVIPPVGELILDDPAPGEVHIKYGYIRGGDRYVIKIASGFPLNRELGIQSGNGMMLLFNQRTGELDTILHDEAYLTDVRTAAAGALASRTLAPSEVDVLGIVGTGVQAALQLEHASRALGCTNALVWGRTPERVDLFREQFAGRGVDVEAAADVPSLADSCRVIITCTSATEPLIEADWVRPGTHITAVGSDTPEKQELDASLLARADRVVVDSLEQGRLRGEVARALSSGAINETGIIELGALLGDPTLGRMTDEEITVADLTGVAVQDLKIAEAVLQAL